ncbi:hypothetical protein SAMN05444158_6911 [Bradyrhizobium canariense]|uniref:DUF680 domain-containing protein n=1 Tax=Bradyrhizobium canariense TaxID=255045 RepID=A0A1H2B8F0_9BRAD|nr:hypothetical protein SAMN05444158_6911 [Bradyrhizobium canariense]
MLKTILLAISLLSSLAAMSASAFAGSTITDKNHGPSKARLNVQNRTAGARSDFNSALAYDQTASRLQPVTAPNEGGSPWRYYGGPHPR